MTPAELKQHMDAVLLPHDDPDIKRFITRLPKQDGVKTPYLPNNLHANNHSL